MEHSGQGGGWFPGTWWTETEGDQLRDAPTPVYDAISQDQLAALLVCGAVLLLALIWLVMQISSKLMGLFKTMVVIWIGVALYNRAAAAVETSVNTVRLVAFLYNITGGVMPWGQ